MVPKEWEQLIKNTLDEALQPLFVVVFGSYAKGNARNDSDLDLAYYSEKTLTSYQRFLLAGDLSEKCNVEVDLVNLREVDTVFAAQIFSTGELLYCTDENVFIRERMKAYSMYAKLNEERAEILLGIEKRGTILG
ncbi:type VII toxin-antitoxin system MntA family adenylyltransferase antitoxin [Lentibacillus sediminis]|uniref:type VII toxin-antitoxin system MntA family adenylyltransferase antitoxin n=1 Tax=Lentibacillus sediminis TaxID=1940529 RepID=UPI000C1BFC63|nr:nucleotidyltransferase domain-containing protein [Lentibacillus sediminis]